MKRLLAHSRGKLCTILLFVFSAAAAAQQSSPSVPARREATLSPTPPPVTANVTQRLVPITHSDLYCSGFMTKEQLPQERFVQGGLNTPHTTRYVVSDLIFLHGTGYQPGTRVSIVRKLRDPNRYYLFHDESQLVKSGGQAYKDLGYADIIENRGADIAVARVEFSCDTIVLGDLVIPFMARPAVPYRETSTVDRFPAEAPRPVAYIVMNKDFDQYFGAGAKVYLNTGADRGLRPGDYLRIVRTYQKAEMDTADAASYSASEMEDTQKSPPHISKGKLQKDLPRRVVGEVVILGVQPSSSVAMVTFSLEEIHIGDSVERESPAPPIVKPVTGQ